MNVNVIGGGPGGLYAAILLKKQNPDACVRVFEREAKDNTFGFGIVLSVETLGRLDEADPESCAAIRENFTYWDDLHILFKGQNVSSKGHGFSGMERLTLLRILQQRAQELGVECVWSHAVSDYDELRDADLVIASDGVYSQVRETFAHRFKPSVVSRPNRFVWLGSTIPLPGFTFIFKENGHGIWIVHSYQYKEGCSTFVVETTPDTYERAGLKEDDEAATVAYMKELFKEELRGHELITNKSIWRQFPVINCERWHFENIVLLGDAAHTAHYSIGSGTKLAMEDAIALASCLKDGWHDVPRALQAYEMDRRPPAQRIQRAAEVSLRWFEALGRYWSLSPITFNFSLLTRSKHITYENLRLRDPGFIAALNRSISGESGPNGAPVHSSFALGSISLGNRLVDVRANQRAELDGAPSSSIALLAPVSCSKVAVETVAPAGSPDLPFGIALAINRRDVDREDGATAVDAALSAAEIGACILELDLRDVQEMPAAMLARLAAQVRAKWPTDLIVSARLAETANEEATVGLAALLKNAGVAMLHVWGRATDVASSVNLAERIRLELGVVVLLSNAISSDDDRNTAIGAGRADLVSSSGCIA